MTLLSAATAPSLASRVERPSYDRSAVRRGIVHLGIGAFHRAHQAMIFDSILNSGDHRWGITGASLRSPAVRDQMRPQDWLYTVVTRGEGQEHYRLVGSISEILVATEEPKMLVDRIASPETKLVTLTITEKGYKFDRAGGGLQVADEDVRIDLRTLAAPRTAIGFLTAALALRHANGSEPLTILSCDNLPDNGGLLRSAVSEMAEAHDSTLSHWIATECSFLNSMVDRIVPATRAEDLVAISQRIGIEDRAAVKTESFCQWVIEDRFVCGKPDLQSAGVHLTDDVRPWEVAKLRLLNGAHSAIAYLGGLMGIEHVDEFVSMPSGEQYINELWSESRTTFVAPSGLDVEGYCRSLIQRFRNSSLAHRTSQIAMDGSQKLPQRLCAPIETRLKQSRSADALALAVAAWIRWQGGVTDDGRKFVVDDPLAQKIERTLRGLTNPRDQVHAALSLREIFSEPLANHVMFRELLVQHLESLTAFGVRATLRRVAATANADAGT